ncbi:WD repeat-containing protein 35, partial [Entophlyctis luteolus]
MTALPLARALFVARRFDECRRVLATEPKTPLDPRLLQLADRVRRTEGIPQSSDIIKVPDAADSFYSSPVHLLHVARSYFLSASHDQAIATYEKAIQMDPSDWRAHYFKSLSHKALKDFPQAISSCLTAAGLQKHELVLMELGKLYTLLNDFDGAVSVYEDGIKSFPLSSEFAVALGLLYLRIGDCERALSMAELAFEKDPGSSKALQTAIMSTELMARQQQTVLKAQKTSLYYKLLMSACPDSPVLLSNLAHHLMESAEKPTDTRVSGSAMASLQRAVRLSVLSSWEAAFNLGQVCLESEMLVSAFCWFNVAAMIVAPGERLELPENGDTEARIVVLERLQYMFVFLSKKIAIPNGVKLRTVAWDNDQGWIACGGEDGLLKVLKLENPPPVTPASLAASGDSKKPQGEATASSSLSMNQTLEGHSGAVIVSKWNEQYKKLTTSDQFGLIIVWILYKGTWYEEMINNRNKSVVADMQWSKDGQRICIIYEDGAVIVGSVDGNRIWGKELKQTNLSFVQWSPDAKNILFGLMSGELHIYDATGTYLSKLPVYCSENAAVLKISAIDWYNGNNGYVEPRAPCLAIAFENGKIQIMRDDKDQSPLVLDTNMRFLNIKWNSYGSILAVSGVQFARSSQGEEKEVSVVQFYDPFGQYMRSLKVPGKKITSLSWENGGLRLALAVDSFIYFANIRPDYKWCYFASDVLAYGFQKYEQPETTVVYWNTKTGDRYVKLINKLCFMTAHGEYCLIVSKADDSGRNHLLTVSNAIGTAIETRQIQFAPITARITKTHVIAASADTVFCWQFRIPPKKSGALDVIRKMEGGLKDRVFHIDDVGDSPNVEIPSITLEAKYNVPIRPLSIHLNCNNTRLAMLDMAGVLKVLELGKRTMGGNTGSYITANVVVEGAGRLLDLERKDVWNIEWASDDPESFAIIEKTRMFIIDDIVLDEPIPCSG